MTTSDSPTPRHSRRHGTSPRQMGTNPRARGINPRAAGTNPRAEARHGAAGTPRDVAAVLAARDTAMAILRLAGLVWCARCGDGGTILASSVTVGGERLHERWAPCECRPFPAAAAQQIAARYGHHLAHAPHMFEAPGMADKLAAMLPP